MIGCDFLDLAFLASYDTCGVEFRASEGGGDTFECYPLVDARYREYGTVLTEIISDTVIAPSRGNGWLTGWYYADAGSGVIGVDTYESYGTTDAYGVFNGTLDQNGTGWSGAWVSAYTGIGYLGSDDFESYGSGTSGPSSVFDKDDSWYGTVFGFSGSWVLDS